MTVETARPITTSRVHAFDTLRVLGAIGVVVLHSAATTVVTSPAGTGVWSGFDVANVFDSTGRFAVDCFFMISGALLLAPEHAYRLGKQLRRVLVPLLVWSIVYVLVDEWFAHLGQSTITGSLRQGDLDDPGRIIVTMATSPVAYHLWFLYIIVALYLLTPLVRTVTSLEEPRSRQLLLYGLVLWLVVEVGLRFAPVVWTAVPDVYGNGLAGNVAGYLGIFVLGHVLFRHPLPGRVWMYGVMAAAGFVWIVVATWAIHRHPDGVFWVWQNASPPVLMFAVGTFVVITRTVTGGGRLQPAIALFSRLSFRIYLMHLLVLQLLRRFGPTSDLYHDHNIWSIPVLAALTVAISFAAAWAIDRIRPIRAYV